MQALDIVLDVLNINIVEKVSEKTRRGPKGYKLLLRLRLLLYAVLIEIFETRNLVRHFEQNGFALAKLGFKPTISAAYLACVWSKKCLP